MVEKWRVCWYSGCQLIARFLSDNLSMGIISIQSFYTTSLQGVLSIIESFQRSIERADRLHLIQNFFLIHQSDFVQYDSTQIHFLQRRQDQINRALQKNLNHPYTSTVSILYNDTSTESYINGLDLENRHKMILIKVPGRVGLERAWHYINRNLIGKVVCMINAGITLGDGVKHINIPLFKKDNISLALTKTYRHDDACSDSAMEYDGAERSCTGDDTNISNIDAFIFSMKQRLLPESFQYLSSKLDLLAHESVLVSFLRDKLNYNVWNPCKLIHVYQEHCDNIEANNAPNDSDKF